jgi:hypothetical protein
MILELKDGTQVIVNCIFGGPKKIDGKERDVLRIEIDPKQYTKSSLETLFKDNPNTDMLYTYSTNDAKESDRKEIGSGYNLFVSLQLESKHRLQVPGSTVTESTDSVYMVTLAHE